MIKKPMMFLIGNQEINDYNIIKAELDDIKDVGYDSICLELKNCEYNEFDNQGKQAVKFVYNECVKRNLGFCKIIPHTLPCFLSKYPVLRRKITRCVRLTQLRSSNTIENISFENCLPTGVLSVFRFKEGNTFEKCALNLISLNNGKLSAKEDGEYLVYLEFLRENEADYANKETYSFLDKFLETFSDLKLDGIAMDEFGAGSRLDKAYLANESFFSLFQKKYKYDLRDKIYLLDIQDKTGEFAQVRLDYFTLTHDLTYEYQKYAKLIFTQKYGDDIFIGFHHTWWGEGNSGDLWAGNIDYFRLAENLSGGYVDAQYDSERTMLSMSLLAESIAKIRGGEAWNMCWDRHTTPEKFEYFSRVLSIRNVHRIGHSVSKSDAEIFPEFNFFVDNVGNNKAFGNVRKCLQREYLFEKFIGNAKNLANVAITYNWESCAYFNNDYMHYHRLSLKALADKLIRNNISVDIIPSDAVDFSRYQVIFVVWATVTTESQWLALKKAASEGKKIIFIGPPAIVTDEGRDIRNEFTELTGAKIVKNDIFYGGYEVYQWDLWFTDKQIPMLNWMDENGKSQFEKGSVSYYAYELPLTDIFFDILTELVPLQIIRSDKVISKTYCSEYEKIICITSRWQSKINEEFMFDGLRIKVENGELIGIKTQDGKIKSIIADSDTKILIDGKSIKYTEI